MLLCKTLSFYAKQYFFYKNKEIYDHSLEKALDSKLFKKIVLVIDNPKKIKKKYPKNVLIIKGGKERSDSSLIGIQKIKKDSSDGNVFAIFVYPTKALSRDQYPKIQKFVKSIFEAK